MNILSKTLVMSVLILSSTVAVFADEGPKSPELIGYCPVAYVVAGKVVKGDPNFSSTIDGKTYWFLNAEAKGAYDAAPDKFQVACDGYCAYAVAQGAVFPGDPQFFSVKDHTIYFFINAETKAAFDADASMAGKAVVAWKTLKKS